MKTYFPLLSLFAILFGGCSSLRTAPLISKAISNPLITGDRPDPFIFQWPAGARGNFYLTHTKANGIPLLKSHDLVTWTETKNVFSSPPTPPDKPWRINQQGFCHVWAPEFFSLGGQKVIVTFSAVGYEGAAIPEQCPAFEGNPSIYAMTSENGMGGPFGKAEKEPTLLGHSPECDRIGDYPKSPGRVKGCDVGRCDKQFRIDGSYFSESGKTFFAYVWFSNPQVRNWNEKRDHGFNISLVEMDAGRPERTRCETAPRAWHAVSPGDKNLLNKLAASCPACSEWLSFSKNTEGAEWIWQGARAGIVEGPSIFRRGEYLYLLFSHSVYDSAYYGVSWVAAKTIEGLGDEKNRIVGRYLIPSGKYSFGHGTPFIGPDGKNRFYVYHRTDNEACVKNVGRKCERDIFLSPLDFEEKKDGLGAIHIKPRRPDRDDANLTLETFE